MKRVLTRNLMWKIVSVVLAILLWLVVINVEDPWTTDEIRDITVQLRFDESITANNKAYEVIKGETITVRVEGKRSVIDNLRPEDIRAVADMRMLSITNSVPIEVEVNRTKPVEVVRWEPQNLLVNVEDIRPIQAGVQYQIIGTPNAPYVIGNVTVEPNIVQITGPESQINRIKSVVVPVEIDANNVRDIILDATPYILDSHGNEVSKVTLNTTVKVTVNIDKERTVPIRMETVGEPPEGYVLTGFNYSPTSIRIAGREAQVDAISSIVIPPIDISDYTEDTEFTISIKEYLPENIRLHASPDEITVRVGIESSIEKDISIDINNLDVKSLPRELRFRYLTQENINIRIAGRESLVRTITKENIITRIDLRDLEPGRHTIPVEVVLPRGVTIIGPMPMVDIELEIENEEGIGDESIRTDNNT
ncbi:YbbR domain-containing protein [Natranaerovirga pectinivora]|uniref:YbbR domain-containing protein n=1 Tax=Natranaerovirga pectinivora TaxID=682400 RepID=A0A4R3MPA5_9FIRM|nr:CdaR family protein [Natranaerovirga pectinivora]TCT14664.1 YbbR domain-containing protein [Natranaerovirga pectinivora]